MSVADQMREFDMAIVGHPHELEIQGLIAAMAAWELERRSCHLWQRKRKQELVEKIEKARFRINYQLLPDKGKT